MLEPLASSPGWLVSGGDHHPLLRLLQSGRKRQDHDGGRPGLVAHTPPVVPQVLWPCQNTILAAKTLLGLPVGCVLSPPFLEPAILISAALPAPPDPSAATRFVLLCPPPFIRYPSSPCLVLHTSARRQDLLSIQDGLWESGLPPAWWPGAPSRLGPTLVSGVTSVIFSSAIQADEPG